MGGRAGQGGGVPTLKNSSLLSSQVSFCTPRHAIHMKDAVIGVVGGQERYGSGVACIVYEVVDGMRGEGSLRLLHGCL